MRTLLLMATLLGLVSSAGLAQQSNPWAGSAVPQESNPWAVRRILESCRDFIKRGDKEPDALKALNEGMCGGFFSGLIFYSMRLPDPARFCPPDTATVREAIFLVITQVEKRPELMYDDIRTIAPVALRVDWPCK